MGTRSRVFRIVQTGVAVVLLAFLGLVRATPITLPAVQETFDTEILSLNLSGSGQLPLPFPGGKPVPGAPDFSFFDVFLEISPTPGAHHPGQMTVTPTGSSGGMHQIDSFFDIFFDVTFSDAATGRLLIDLPGQSTRITGRNTGMPDAMGHFSPGGHYSGSGMLDDIELLPGSFFDITYMIDLDFGGGFPPAPVQEGTLHKFDATAQFNGQINPPFGPFRLTSPGTDPVQILVRDVPEPGTLALICLGLLGPVALRRKRPAA